jgi:hypothetical protein
MAGMIYAQEVGEAASQAAERRTAYRGVRKEWHSFLGSTAASLMMEMQALVDVINQGNEWAPAGRPTRPSELSGVGVGDAWAAWVAWCCWSDSQAHWRPVRESAA